MHRDLTLQLFILLTLSELSDSGFPDIGNHIRRRKFLRFNPSSELFQRAYIRIIEEDCIEASNNCISLTSQGWERLFSLCNQATFEDIAPDGFSAVKQTLALEPDYWAVRARLEREKRAQAAAMQVQAEEMQRFFAKLERQLRETLGNGYPYDVLLEAKNAPKHDYYHHYVYVIELDKKVKRKYPTKHLDPELPCVYVGESWHEPEERFRRHLEGPYGSKYVRPFGLHLLPQLYEHYNPLPSRETAREIEEALSEKLRLDGYAVYGGH